MPMTARAWQSVKPTSRKHIIMRGIYQRKSTPCCMFLSYAALLPTLDLEPCILATGPTPLQKETINNARPTSVS